MSIHLILSEQERLVVVNALAFYSYRHSQESQLSSDEDEQFEMAFNEDIASVNVDALATKIAQLS